MVTSNKKEITTDHDVVDQAFETHANRNAGRVTRFQFFRAAGRRAQRSVDIVMAAWKQYLNQRGEYFRGKIPDFLLAHSKTILGIT